MSELKSGIDTSAAAPSTCCNRLSIAHLLLWMAMTGIVLASLKINKPRAPQPISIGGGFGPQAGDGDGRRERIRRAQERFVRTLNAQYLVNVAFAPMVGAAFGGVTLAFWRLATRKFCFPIQPGHWLLVGLGGTFLLASVRPLLQSQIPDSRAEIVVAGAATLLFGLITVAMREPLRWRIAFGLLSVAFGLALLGFLISVVSGSIEPPPVLAIAFLFLFAFPIAVITCTLLDISESHRYDIFHWIGIAMLLGVGAKFAVAFAVNRFIT